MLTAILAFIIGVGLIYGLRVGRTDDVIVHHPYNNRYNDASGARDESF